MVRLLSCDFTHVNTRLTSKSAKCEEVGHLIQDCKEKRFKSRNPAPPKRNLEAGKPVHEPSPGQTTASGENLASGGGGDGSSAWGDGAADNFGGVGGGSSNWDDPADNSSGGGGVGASTGDDGFADANEQAGVRDHSDGEASEPSETDQSVRGYD